MNDDIVTIVLALKVAYREGAISKAELESALQYLTTHIPAVDVRRLEEEA